MGQVLVQVVLALTAVRALSIPNHPSAEPMTLPMNFERSEPNAGCLLKRSEHTEHEHKKRGIQSSCGQFQQQVDEAFEKCSQRAGNALKALEGANFPAKDTKDTSGNGKRAGQETGRPKADGKETLQKLLEDWFSTGANDQQALTKMKKDFTNIKSECEKKDTSRVAVKCEQCQQGIAGQTYQGTGPITLCMVALDDDRNSTNIRAQDLGDVLLHEMSHVVGYTDDRGYGVEKCKQLDKRSSLDNADSFTKFALATTVGDTTGSRGEGGQSPGGPFPGGPFPGGPFPGGSFPGGQSQGGPSAGGQLGGFEEGEFTGSSEENFPGPSEGPFPGLEGGQMGDGESSFSSGQFPPPGSFSPPEAASSIGFSSSKGVSSSRGSSRVASPPENLLPLQKSPHAEDSPPPSKGTPPTAMVLPYAAS